MWECDGVKYYADELKYMPVHYRYVNEYKTGCTLYVSGLDQRLKEFQAVEALATCMGRWPVRNCGVLAVQILRKGSLGLQGGSGISGGAFVRLANKELVNAYMYHMNGITFRSRTLMVQLAQEFELRPRTRNPGMVGQQRYVIDVWSCPVDSL